MIDAELLNEVAVVIRPDNTFRRQGQHIVIAQMNSITPVRTILDPSIWWGSSSVYTWGKVQEYFTRHPFARRNQLPMHFYSEYLYDDYVTYVGCPKTNKSWFLQQAAAAGVIPVQYQDAILIVTQENYTLSTVENRCWKVLAHSLLTPMMREDGISRERVVFFEQIVDRNRANSEDWPFRYRDPVFLDPAQLDMFLKEYGKR